ncbi:MAG: nucleoside-diphosphate kinase [Sporomusa sp.]
MNNQESTLVLLKPDAVKRNICGEIISRFERRGLHIAALKLVWLTRAVAAKHYEEHVDKPFYPALLDFITSGPVIAIVISGPQAVSLVRKMIGATNPAEAQPGTIRGDYAALLDNNIIHGSDSIASAQREIAVHFTAMEIYE